MSANEDTYRQIIWKQFHKRILGRIALYILILFCLVGIYAPFLASSKPLFVNYDGVWYFPLFRYLFYRGFYTKGLDIFFNLLMFTAPLAILAGYFLRRHTRILFVTLLGIFAIQFALFLYFCFGPVLDPASDSQLSRQQQQELVSHSLPDWNFDLKYMNDYKKFNLVLTYQLQERQQQNLQTYIGSRHLPTLWQQKRDNEEREIKRYQSELASSKPDSNEYQIAKASITYLEQRHQWIADQSKLLTDEVMPLIRPFHWQDDAGGSQELNHLVPFWDQTRVNRTDLVAALIFGVRISLVVGILSVSLALMIGLPIGAFAGFYGGKFDILMSRFLEVWEAMPTFFMLLMVVAIMQNKSIFLVIAIIGFFGWTSFSRYMRGEFFKQRNLPYVEACRAIGFNDSYIIFSHILPNAIPPVLTLLPFAIMGAITSEAGLSFLGLGEEGSCSWGVLMDEGRSVFPGESGLLWPPAILLTILLVTIAIVGDTLRDALDPKMHRL